MSDITDRLRAAVPKFDGVPVAWRCEVRSELLLEAAAEVERLRAETERLFNEDTKTRHALGGWVWVCPDGGDEPTHERVAAVVAEVERLRENVERLGKEVERADWLRAEIARVKADDRKNRADIKRLRAEIEKLREALEGKA